jgi:SAM-dependent methyltransferase
MKRIVQPELLDSLPPDDPRAVRSRRDLRRVNAWMRHHDIMALALQKSFAGHVHGQITELGAGDGHFLLQVAQKIKAGQASGLSKAPDAKATLLDRQSNVSAEILAAFATLGWRPQTLVTDVFDWPQADNDIVIANLFLHHFEDARLAELLNKISRSAKLFIALEPRRARWPLFCSRLLWAIGCNDVTRHDAVVSVRAGFDGKEISTHWPNKNNWQLTEQSAGWFSHLFIARRIDEP